MTLAAPIFGSATIETTVNKLRVEASHTHHGALTAPAQLPLPSHPVVATAANTSPPTRNASVAASTGDFTTCSIRLFAAICTGITAPPNTTRASRKYRI